MAKKLKWYQLDDDKTTLYIILIVAIVFFAGVFLATDWSSFEKELVEANNQNLKDFAVNPLTGKLYYPKVCNVGEKRCLENKVQICKETIDTMTVCKNKRLCKGDSQPGAHWEELKNCNIFDAKCMYGACIK